MDGETLDNVPDCNDGYPENWPDIPDIKERLLASYRNLRVFDLTIEQLPNDQESYGFHAQQSIENAVKAWVSATGLSYRRTHDLAEIILDDPEQAAAPDPDYPGDTI